MSDQRDAISSKEEIEIISGESQGEAGSDQSRVPNRGRGGGVESGQASGSVSENP